MAVQEVGRKTRKTVKGARVERTPRVSASYLALIREFPIRPIRSDRELDDASAAVDRLLCRKHLDRFEQDYLEILGYEIERYEKQAYPMPEVSGPAMLRHLIAAREATLSDVASETGIVLSTLSAIRNGKRKMNLKHVEALSEYFGVEPGVLF